MSSYPISPAAIECYVPAREQFEHLLGRLMDKETQDMRHGEVETLVKAEGSELLRRMMQGYFDQRSAEEPIHERVVGKDGTARTHRRVGCTRLLETCFTQKFLARRRHLCFGSAC